MLNCCTASRALVLATGLMLTPQLAAAHPHVWITARSDVVFNEAGLIVAVVNDWTLDEAYSAVASDGLDVNHDGTYDTSELEPLTKENIDSLKDFEYFTYVYQNAQKVSLATPDDASQSMMGRNLRLRFRVPLSTPIDPKTQAFTYRVYDPSFYIAVEFDPSQPVHVVAAPSGCESKIEPPKQTEELSSTKDMLASKPMDWQAPVEENFGALFADVVAVHCK